MNKANRKFKKLLEKDTQKLLDATFGTIDDYNKEELKKAFLGQTVKPDDNINDFLDGRVDAFYLTHKREFDELDTLNLLLKSYEGKVPFFDDFPVLQTYLDKYQFSTEEQAEVLAYFLNMYYNFVNRDLTDNEERLLRQAIEAEVESSDKFMFGILRKNAIKNKLNIYYAGRERSRTYLKYFRELVSEEGELLPLIDALELETSLLSLGLELSTTQVDMILGTSLSRAYQESDENFKAAVNELALAEARAEREHRLEQSIIEISRQEKIRKEAVRSLRTYLTDDMPIKYLDEVAISRVLELLNICGYTPNQIASIKRNILENNKKIIEIEAAAALNAAKELYLSESEREFLSNIELALISNERLQPFMKKQIEENYNMLKEQLILCYKHSEFSTEPLNDEAEFMILCLQELAATFDMYVGSNYSLVLGLNSN